MPIRTTAPTRAAATVAALVGALALTACGSTPPPAAPPPTTTATPATTASPPTTTPPATAAAPATAADGTNYGACRDGRCTVEVRAGTTIRFDRSLRISSFRVESVDAGTVVFAAEFPSGGSGNSTSGAGGSGSFNGLTYRILDVRGGTAVVEFTTS